MIYNFSKKVGDPFVEIGRLGFTSYCGTMQFDSTEALETKLHSILKIYTRTWSSNKLSPYWLNNPLNHPSSAKSSEKAVSKSFEKFAEVFKNADADTSCTICGQKGASALGDRSIFPLGFSNTGANFASSFKHPIRVCPSCYFSLLSIPLNTQQVAGKIGFMMGGEIVNGYWQQTNREKLIRQQNASFSGTDRPSLLQSGHKYFENFIYEHISAIADSYTEKMGGVTFYLFTNFAAAPEVQVSYIDETYLDFLHIFSPEAFEKSEQVLLAEEDVRLWKELIFKSYKSSNSDEYISAEEQLKGSWNFLIEKFIRGENLIHYFRRFCLNETKEEHKTIDALIQKGHSYERLSREYLIKVRHMNEERLKYIKELAKNLAELDKKEKIFKNICLCKSEGVFRHELIRAMQQYFPKTGKHLFNEDNFLAYILPKGQSFFETKDYLIIAMYPYVAETLGADTITIEGEEDA